MGLSGISTPFEVLSQTIGQIIHVLLTRAPLSRDRSPLHVRLACVKHAASVRSEPGSNSPVGKLYNLILILLLDLTCCPQTISNVCYLVFKDQLFSSTALWRQKPTLSNLQRSVKVLFFRPVDFFPAAVYSSAPPGNAFQQQAPFIADHHLPCQGLFLGTPLLILKIVSATAEKTKTPEKQRLLR